VLGADEAVIEPAGFRLGLDDNPTAGGAESLEHHF